MLVMGKNKRFGDGFRREYLLQGQPWSDAGPSEHPKEYDYIPSQSGSIFLPDDLYPTPAKPENGYWMALRHKSL
jgi:hypothetical protein